MLGAGILLERRCVRRVGQVLADWRHDVATSGDDRGCGTSPGPQPPRRPQPGGRAAWIAVLGLLLASAGGGFDSTFCRQLAAPARRPAGLLWRPPQPRREGRIAVPQGSGVAPAYSGDYGRHGRCGSSWAAVHCKDTRAVHYRLKTGEAPGMTASLRDRGARGSNDPVRNCKSNLDKHAWQRQPSRPVEIQGSHPDRSILPLRRQPFTTRRRRSTCCGVRPEP